MRPIWVLVKNICSTVSQCSDGVCDALCVGRWGEEDIPFSFPFSSPTGFATMDNQAVSDAMPLFLECLQPYKVSYNPQSVRAHINELMVERYTKTPPRGLVLDSIFICNLFSSYRTKSCYVSQASYKNVSALCLSIYFSECHLIVQNKPSKNRDNRNKSEKSSALKWSDRLYTFHGIQNLNKA